MKHQQQAAFISEIKTAFGVISSTDVPTIAHSLPLQLKLLCLPPNFITASSYNSASVASDPSRNLRLDQQSCAAPAASLRGPRQVSEPPAWTYKLRFTMKESVLPNCMVFLQMSQKAPSSSCIRDHLASAALPACAAAQITARP